MEIKHIFMLTLFVVTIIFFIIFGIYRSSLVINEYLDSYKYSKILTIFGVIIILLSLINFGLSIFNAVTANNGVNRFLSCASATCSFVFFICGLLIIENNNNNKKNDKL